MPNADTAWITREKITEYLLSSTHPEGRSKAEFFHRLGFRIERWQVLEAALLDHGRTGTAVDQMPAPFGLHYVVEGPLGTPDGRSSLIRTVWIVERGQTAPRLITAYPVGRRDAQRT